MSFYLNIQLAEILQKYQFSILVNRVLNYQNKTIKKSQKRSNKLVSLEGFIRTIIDLMVKKKVMIKNNQEPLSYLCTHEERKIWKSMTVWKVI